ncbi:septal ring lytic transglycosylase RlpA family protein [Treponema primitia]|uniref:septal ring lytic transglycosylase RlpA family protein n=1 Tax=Treponema primitia TaxID=88058 RepID=UPI0002555477|nr:septal ring lytic transglycosylase RlpA family protein [Treponema primitia]
MKRLVTVLLLGISITTLCAAQAQIRNFKQRGAATGTLDASGITAAHPSLPIGTLIKVTNTENNKEVTATVTGRISTSVDRIVDLSPAAASAIGVPSDGSVQIILERVNAVPEPVIVEAEPEPEPEPVAPPPPPPVVVSAPPPPPPPPPPPKVAKGPARIIPRMPDPGSTTIFRVQAGSYLLPLHAREAFDRLVAAGFHPYFERFENYIRVVIPGVPAAYIPWIAQRLGDLDVTEAWIRPESY